MNTKPRTTTRTDGRNNQLRLLLTDKERGDLYRLAADQALSEYVRGLIQADATARGLAFG